MPIMDTTGNDGKGIGKGTTSLRMEKIAYEVERLHIGGQTTVREGG